MPRQTISPSLMYFTPLALRADVTSRMEYTCQTPSSGDASRSYTLYVQVLHGRYDAFWCSCPGFVNRRYCKHNTELKNRIAAGTVNWVVGTSGLGTVEGSVPPVQTGVRTGPSIQATIGEGRPAGRMNCGLPGCCLPVETPPATETPASYAAAVDAGDPEQDSRLEFTFGLDGSILR